MNRILSTIWCTGCGRVLNPPPLPLYENLEKQYGNLRGKAYIILSFQIKLCLSVQYLHFAWEIEGLILGKDFAVSQFLLLSLVHESQFKDLQKN